MSRASDIRTYIVAKQPNMTIDDLYVLVSQLHGAIEALTSLRQNNEKPPMPVTIKNITLELRGNKVHTKEGIAFSPSSLQTFTEILFLMKGAMGLGSRTFATIDTCIHRDLLLACANVEEDVAKINSEIFSGLLKRFHNRTRVGANNDYQFKYRLSTCKNRFITFDLKNMEFDDDDRVNFDIEVNDPILHAAIGGHHCYSMPTGKVAAQRLSNKIKSSFVEVPQPDTPESLIAGLKKYGMTQNEIDELMDVFCQWLKGNEVTGTVICQDQVSGIYHVTFNHNSDADWDKVGFSIVDEHKTIALGQNFSATTIGWEHAKYKLARVRIPVKIQDGIAVTALNLDKAEMQIYHSLVAGELNPNEMSFECKTTFTDKRTIAIYPITYTSDPDILYRVYVLAGKSMTATLGLVSYKEVMDYLSTIKVLEKSILESKQEIDWGNVITPKVGFWTKVKRLFKAA